MVPATVVDVAVVFLRLTFVFEKLGEKEGQRERKAFKLPKRRMKIPFGEMFFIYHVECIPGKGSHNLKQLLSIVSHGMILR